MKTKYEEIVNVNAIGKAENPISLNEILKKANDEQLTPSWKDKIRVLAIGIDEQNSFMENGELGVPGSHGDVERATRFIYNNAEKITTIKVSLDTHIPQQIFHPCWWIDENGNNPKPNTLITLADLDSGKWRAVIRPIESRDYIEHLEKDGKKTLCIWPYHVLQGTFGCSLENQFANMVYFHSVARKYALRRIVKGQDPLSEMYGIIRPEYDRKGYINIEFLNDIENYDIIIFFGEAASHCVIESIIQSLEYYKNRPDVTRRIYILEDCMSCVVVPGVDFEGITKQAFDELKRKYHVNLVKSTDNFLD